MTAIATLYLRRERWSTHDGIRVRVSPGVFHPGLFFSTKILLSYLATIDLKRCRVLELGAGSGLIALTAAARGAIVTASEISEAAIKDLRFNAALNHLALNVIRSDLFENIPAHAFDLVIINPPYFPTDPVTDRDRAWMCGSGFEYFHRLFEGLTRRGAYPTTIIMILSEHCALETIRSIAQEFGFSLNAVRHVTNWLESNDLYSITSVTPITAD